MSALKPYPHYEINVKDNSIYRFAVDEILPVHRPLWVIRAQEGPVGDPVWCSNASDLKKKFGEQTLNLANKDYASPQTFFLNQTMSYDGAFIVRALPKDARYATAILQAVVETTQVVQYEKDENGNRIIDLDVDSDNYGKPIPVGGFENPEKDDGIKITFQVRPAQYDEEGKIAENLSHLAVSNTTVANNIINDGGDPSFEGGNPQPSNHIEKTVYPLLAIRSLYPGEYGNELAFRFFYRENENSAPNTALFKSIFNCFSVSRREYNNSNTNVIFDLFGRQYTTFTADPDCTDPESGVKMDMDTVVTNAFDVDSSEGSDFPFVVYTYEENLNTIGKAIVDVEAEYNGGSSLAFEEFGYRTIADFKQEENRGYMVNVLSGTNINGIPYDHVAISGRMDVDPTVEYVYTVTTDSTYQADTDYYKCVPFSDDYPAVKKYIKLVSGDDYTVGSGISLSHYTETSDTTYQANKEYYQKNPDETYSIIENVVVGGSIENTVYEKVGTPIYVRQIATDHTSEYDTQNERVILDSGIDMFLAGGSDGSLKNTSEAERDDFVDHYMYQFLKLHVNPKIVDKFRYPITHIYDPGYSMTTKYAMLDFLDTRDDVAVELSTQVLFPSKWATGYSRDIKLNDQAKDIQDGMVLRERAMLMRESVLKGTECMRASIYTQAGKPVSATYTKAVPFTFWSAMKHAMYGNRDQMDVQEPRGLPYSYNELFKTWNWINYSETMKEKTWNAGLNYCQYADMKRIFYPALRTVYREETSVLVDQWVVDALVYTKHECRKAWARFSGRNDKKTIIEAAIKVYLEDILSYLYNGKYDFSVSVYKTEEENKLGYIEHVKLTLTFPATMRVINFDIEVNREGYDNGEREEGTTTAG